MVPMTRHRLQGSFLHVGCRACKYCCHFEIIKLKENHAWFVGKPKNLVVLETVPNGASESRVPSNRVHEIIFLMVIIKASENVVVAYWGADIGVGEGKKRDNVREDQRSQCTLEQSVHARLSSHTNLEKLFVKDVNVL